MIRHPRRLLTTVTAILCGVGACATAALHLAAGPADAATAAQSTTSPCPATHPVAVAAGPSTSAQQQLAPGGADAIHLCEYSGLNATPRLALIGSAVISDSGTIASLISQYNALPVPPAGPEVCPLDDGSQIVAHLTYSDGDSVMIVAHETGCQDVTNNYVLRTLAAVGGSQAGASLLTHLRTLLGPAVTTCGVPYTLTVSGKQIGSGSCAGLIGPTVHVTVKLGQTFTIGIVHEENGALDVPIPAPSNAVVRMIHRRGATVSYRATKVGAAKLVAKHTRFCMAADPRVSSCAAYTIKVTG